MTAIEKLLEEKRRLINERLDTLLVPSCKEHEILYESMNYSLLAGGKRVRPALFLMVLDMLGADSTVYLNTACAIECVHTYSLIHDDLPAMDNDDYRRERLTNHKVYGAGMATLAGDGLLTYAMELLAGEVHIPSDIRCQLVFLLAKAAGPSGMVGGQAQDILSEERRFSLEELSFMDRCKTGCLLCAPIDMAAVSAGASEEMTRDLHAYGRHAGLLFQIIDDILDDAEDEHNFSQDAHGDGAVCRATYCNLLGIDGARQMACDEGQNALDALTHFGKEAEPLRQMIPCLLERTK